MTGKQSPTAAAQDQGTAQERAEALDRQASLRVQLRAMYGAVVNEPVPDTFLSLLDDLERKEVKG